MNDQPDFTEISPELDVKFFSRLTMDRVLVEYDMPLAFFARDNSSTISPRGSRWFITWRAGGRPASRGPGLGDISGVETWVAVRVSKRRRLEILKEHISLREAMLLNEELIFILTGHDPLRPASVGALMSFELPELLLPVAEISVFGKAMALGTESEAKEDELSVALHFVPYWPGSSAETWSNSARVQDHLSDYLRHAARAVFEKSIGHRVPKSGWTAISMASASSGTLTINGKSRRLPPLQVKSMDEALLELKKMEAGEVSQSHLRSLEQSIGKTGILSLYFLTDELSKQESPLTIRWRSGRTERSTSMSTAASKRLRRVIGEYITSHRTSYMSEQAKIIVKLTDAEVSKLMKRIDRQSGGWQALLDDLQHQFVGPNEIEVKPIQVERILRYYHDYGTGSFQTRLEPIYMALYSLRLASSGLK